MEKSGWGHGQVLDERGRRKYLSDAERARFLHAADRLAPAQRALCHVLAYAGCRISEALALTLDHVDAERLALTIRTLKRRRVVFRAVPMPPAAIELLLKLPLHQDQRFWTLHRTTAWRIVTTTMQRAGINGPMACPKGLRHGFGMAAAGHKSSAGWGTPRRRRRQSTWTPSVSRNGGSRVACGDTELSGTSKRHPTQAS